MPQPSSPDPRAARTVGAPESPEFLAPLLHALAESLDVRDVFARISAEARRLVPHDFLMLGLLTPGQDRIRVQATRPGR